MMHGISPVNPAFLIRLLLLFFFINIVVSLPVLNIQLRLSDLHGSVQHSCLLLCFITASEMSLSNHSTRYSTEHTVYTIVLILKLISKAQVDALVLIGYRFYSNRDVHGRSSIIAHFQFREKKHIQVWRGVRGAHTFGHAVYTDQETRLIVYIGMFFGEPHVFRRNLRFSAVGKSSGQK